MASCPPTPSPKMHAPRSWGLPLTVMHTLLFFFLLLFFGGLLRGRVDLTSFSLSQPSGTHETYSRPRSKPIATPTTTTATPASSSSRGDDSEQHAQAAPVAAPTIADQQQGAQQAQAQAAHTAAAIMPLPQSPSSPSEEQPIQGGAATGRQRTRRWVGHGFGVCGCVLCAWGCWHAWVGWNPHPPSK